MSLEAWGDEGNVPTSAEDTAAVQEWRKVLKAISDWKKRNADDMPDDDWMKLWLAAGNAADAFDDWLIEAMKP